MNKHIIYELINKENAGDRVTDVVNGMTVGYRVMLDADEDAVKSFAITNRNVNMLGVNRNDLFVHAHMNTCQVLPVNTFSMASFFGVSEGDNIKVLTNVTGVYGATSILYDGVLDEMQNIIGSPYYILPSSIHEVILLPDDEGIELDDTKSMVKEINKYVVAPAERLGDEIMHYDRGLKYV